VDRYQKVIYNVAIRISGDYDDAEDITQSVFIKVWEKLDTYKPKFKFYSWIYRMAINESLNHIKKRKQQEELDPGMLSEQHTPDQAYAESELSRQIEDALMEVDTHYRMVLVLRHFQNCSYREMAYILNIPEKTVKSRLFTARHILKELLLKKGMMANEY